MWSLSKRSLGSQVEAMLASPSIMSVRSNRRRLPHHAHMLPGRSTEKPIPRCQSLLRLFFAALRIDTRNELFAHGLDSLSPAPRKTPLASPPAERRCPKMV